MEECKRMIDDLIAIDDEKDILDDSRDAIREEFAKVKIALDDGVPDFYGLRQTIKNVADMVWAIERDAYIVGVHDGMELQAKMLGE